MLDRTCLKEMGIKSLGKQLQILGRVKDLIGRQEEIEIFIYLPYMTQLIVSSIIKPCHN